MEYVEVEAVREVEVEAAKERQEVGKKIYMKMVKRFLHGEGETH